MIFQSFKIFFQLALFLLLIFPHPLMHFDSLSYHCRSLSLQLLLLPQSSQDHVRFCLSGLHIQVQTQRNNQDGAQKNPNDGGKENDRPSRHSFGVVVPIADG